MAGPLAQALSGDALPMYTVYSGRMGRSGTHHLVFGLVLDDGAVLRSTYAPSMDGPAYSAPKASASKWTDAPSV